MKLHEMPSPGAIPNAIALRQEVLKAIDYCRVMADKSPGHDGAKKLREFFVECAKLNRQPKEK